MSREPHGLIRPPFMAEPAGSAITAKLMFLVLVVLLVLHMYAEVGASCSYEHYWRVYSCTRMGQVAIRLYTA